MERKYLLFLVTNYLLCLSPISCTTLSNRGNGASHRRNKGEFVSPFHFGNKKNLVSERVRNSLSQAEADYKLALLGKEPKFAVPNEEAGSGTLNYKGDGYALKILQATITIGETSGFLFGPIIKFDKSIVEGNPLVISRVEYFTSEELDGLMSGQHRVTTSTLDNPFHFGKKNRPSDEKVRELLRKAAEDYRLVLIGDLPKFAVEGDNSLNDGTAFYHGSGYSLTRLHLKAVAGETRGFLYGPILKFDPSISIEDANSISKTEFQSISPADVGVISQIEFFTDDELKKLEGNF